MSKKYKEMCSFENIYEAHKKSRRGKRNKNEVIRFEMNLSENLFDIQRELLSHQYCIRGYREFQIFDPKKRIIHALSYRDRIVQHTLCDNVLEPYWENHLIYDNAASRIGKGTHFAMNRLTSFMRAYYKKFGCDGYIMKFDIRGYYDNIDHNILYGIYEKAFTKEVEIRMLLWHIINSYHTKQGKGIPLGNQSSSWFALSYLDGLDRLIKEKFRIKYYSRYMDDGVLIHQDKDILKEYLMLMTDYIKKERKLEFNDKTQIVPISQGVDYLGFRFYMTDTGKVIRRLRSSNKRRIKRKMKRYRHAYRVGKMDRESVERSLASYRGHLSHGNTWHLQKNLQAHLILSKSTKQEREEEKLWMKEKCHVKSTHPQSHKNDASSVEKPQKE